MTIAPGLIQSFSTNPGLPTAEMRISALLALALASLENLWAEKAGPAGIEIGRLPGEMPCDLVIRTLRNQHPYASLRFVSQALEGHVRDRKA